jgi:hypothetical protein
MVALLLNHLQVLTLHQSNCGTFITLVVHAMSWTIVCNRGKEKFLNWNPWMGMYAEPSPSHASNVGLILNPRTGHVLPQYHVVYDDDFMTAHICTLPLSLHIEMNWLKPPLILKFILNSKWGHGNPFPSMMWIRETLPLTPLKH